MNPTSTKSWRELASSAKSSNNLASHLEEEGRLDRLVHNIGRCRFDFSKQNLSLAQLHSLLHLAEEMELAEKRDHMLMGERINLSEDRAVLHTALRGTPLLTTTPGGSQENIAQDVQRVLDRMYELAEAVQQGKWRGHTGKRISTIVHIGIGGSHLGPELVTDALANYHSHALKLHYVANVDAQQLRQALTGSNPETTLFIIASKTFSTLETQVNARSARSWFLERGGSPEGIARHFVAVTNNLEAAAQFGLPEQNLLPMWDWVGGRYSLWSAVGLPIALILGRANHEALLQGAALADQHFANTDLANNVPVLSALLATWNYNFLGAGSLALLCYDERLRLLPSFLQQLETESNGKSVDINGKPVDYDTMAVLWGGTGTTGQHAYHQLLHQGTRAFAADFIVVATDDHQHPDHHRWLNANALGQSQAMAQGYAASTDEPHRAVAGNHSSTVITLDQLGPEELGILLATYEHKVFSQAAIWNINAFDQWGVELGKNLAIPIEDALAQPKMPKNAGFDPSTTDLIRHLRNTQN